jgi:ATP-binding cassette subfamily B protein
MTILQMPVRQPGLLVNSFARTATCGARVFAFLDLEPAVADRPGARPLALTAGELRFDHVGFAQPTAPDKPVLTDLSSTARRGERVGIVAPPALANPPWPT